MRVYNLYRCDTEKSPMSMVKIKATASLGQLRDTICRQIVDGYMQFSLQPKRQEPKDYVLGTDDEHPKVQARNFVKLWNEFTSSTEHQLSEIWDNLDCGYVEVI